MNYFYTIFKVKKRVLLSLICLFVITVGYSQSPTVKIDFDMSGRSAGEVNETGYENWNTYGTGSISNTYEGVTFSIEMSGTNGDGLRSNWYKAGISSAQLVSDGVTVDNGNDGAEILLTISGLSTGEHTLLIFHNNVDNPSTNTFCPVDIYVNSVLVKDDVIPSARAASNYDATVSYLTINATEGNDVAVLFKADTSGSSANNNNVVINAIELNTPNAINQAVFPSPEDADEHVEVTSGTKTLSWTGAHTAVSHNVYFSEDLTEISNADTDSPAFKGNQTGTTYDLTNLNSHSTYYWRIDEVDITGEVTKGSVWYFRPRQVAFPEAEGYGRFARGGRGGKVVHVTNLNDSGEGSFRYAIENETGARTIVFDVSGIITLESRLTLSDDYVTIAGQTAPGKGICIRSAPFGLSGANDVIIQNIRVRLGSGTTYDGMGMQGSNHCIIDHCSISWTIDEAFSSRSAENITLQRTLISEALNIAGHANYPAGTKHGYAASISGDVGSFHHNLLAHCYGRNWSLAGGLDNDGYFSGRLDIFNNVVYNWGKRTTDGGAHEVNFVNNYYKPGAATTIFTALNAEYESFPGTQQYYFEGNVMPGYFDESNQSSGKTYEGTPDGYEPWVDDPFFSSYATIHTAEEAYKNVLSDIGCVQPVLDDHDTRIISETLNGTYSLSGSVSGLPGLPDTEDDAGGYEDYTEETRDSSWDTDKDGLPDWWEEHYGLDTNSADGDYSDANADVDEDGYTNLDDYLQWMMKPHYFVKVDENVQINLSDLFVGYTNSPEYSFSSATNCSVSISNEIATIIPASCGMVSVALSVKDGDEHSMEKEVVAFISSDDSGNCSNGTSDIASIKKGSINIYPNPVTGGTINVVSEESLSELELLTIYNVVGKPVKELVKDQIVTDEYTLQIPVEELDRGVYFIQLQFSDGKIVQSFIKQ